MSALLLLLAAAIQDGSPAGIQWYGTWEQARADARRLDRPILLFSAAPQCHGVPGIW